MKKPLKKMLAKAVHNQTAWDTLNATLFRVTRYLERERFRNDNAPPPPNINVRTAWASIAPDLTVRHGAFSGLKFSSPESASGALIPKLLGSYERELQPLLEQLRARDYSEIVDIGCAEGYYAVGLARMFPKARVFAYDTNPEAVRLCRLMAQVNGIEQRLVTGAHCDAAALRALPLTRRALVVSDCEGYEKHLFTPETVRRLASHDVLIEVHDMVDINISNRLREVFRDTHRLQVIAALDDIRKAQTYEYPELAPFTLAERKVLLAEWRAGAMDWFYFSPAAPE
jgi:SAM-dependent methyltransferase